jgi:hypothetical protein
MKWTSMVVRQVGPAREKVQADLKEENACYDRVV